MDYTRFTVDELKKFIDLADSVLFLPRISDYMFGKSLKTNKNRLFFMDWIMTKIPYTEFVLSNGMKFVFTNNAILPHYKSIKESQIKPMDWHKDYDGRLGYAISQHDLPQKDIIFYKYSASINLLTNDLTFYEINGIGKNIVEISLLDKHGR